MSTKRFVLLAALAVSLLAACAPAAKTPDAMMEPKATDAMMGEKPMETGAGGMMESTATPEMMAEEMKEEIPGTGAMMDATATPDMMMEKTHDPMMGTETPQAGMMEEKESMMAPAWLSAPLLDAKTGETFMIKDFQGKVVLVEPFAQWCSTCLRQQKEVVRLHELLGMPADLVSVSLGVDTKEDAGALKSYMDKNGFDWHFTIASPETAREIGELYGAQFLNPPSAPMLVIDRQGGVHPLPFGVKSAENLQEALKPFLNGGM